MPKIKEFKGSLNPIFNAVGKIDLEIELDARDPAETSKNYLPISQIKPRADQPRKIFNEQPLEELAQSIKANGVIQPIIVSPAPNGFYEIVVGERRWRAAQKAGLEKIPAIIRDYEKSDRMAVALIENIQRENLNPLEEAQAIQQLLQECAMTHHQVAESIGKSRATVSNLLRLLALADEVKIMINSGSLEMGHARALLTLPGARQIELAKVVVGKGLSVRETEKMVHCMTLTPSGLPETALDLEFKKKASVWKRRMYKKLSSKVNVRLKSAGHGQLIVHFSSLKEAEWLMENMAFPEMREKIE